MQASEYQWFVTLDKKPVMEPVNSSVDCGFEKVHKIYKAFLELYEPVRVEIVEIKIYKPVDGEKE